MFRTWEGKHIKANGFRSLAAVKAQFRKVGHVPGLVADLQVNDDGVSFWVCECGAELRFRKEGKTFNCLDVFERPLGTLVDEGRMRLEEGGTALYPIYKMVMGGDPEQDEFNAQLVAAAPAMFRKLKDTVAWLNREIDTWEQVVTRVSATLIERLTELRDDLAETLRKIESRD